MADILPPAPIGNPFGSYVWNDWYQKVRTQINNAQVVQWAAITGTPTTVAGYGITDALTLTGTQTMSNKTHTAVSGRILVLTGTVNNGAGAAAGTLGNAPTAGNPTKWISINDNGTVRYIPTWT